MSMYLQCLVVIGCVVGFLLALALVSFVIYLSAVLMADWIQTRQTRRIMRGDLTEAQQQFRRNYRRGARQQ